MEFKKTCEKIAKELNEPLEFVMDVARYEFEYTANKMKDPNDYHDILFNRLFKFKLKSRFKENKTKENSPKL